MYRCACQVGECVLCEARLASGPAREHACEVRGLLTRQTHRPREILFRQGEPSEHLFLLGTGQVKLMSNLPDGREQILGVRIAGQLLGFEALHPAGAAERGGAAGGDVQHPYTAETLTTVEVCRIRHRDMLAILEQNPAVSLRVIERLRQELDQAQVLIRDLGLKSAPEKVASFILSLVPDDAARADILLMPLSRLEIAEFLGLTVETVSRVFAKFRRDDLIRTPRGRVEILNRAHLSSVAGGISAAPTPRGERALPAY